MHERARRAGFTLVELLLVIALIGVVLGIGLGAIARLDLGEQTALAQVQNTLRAARNHAVAQRAPARVRFDPARNTLQAEGQQTIGTWRFEADHASGAFGLDGAALGGHGDEHGFHGRAWSFVGEGPGARLEFPVHADPACDLRHGFRVACALRVEPEGGGAVLALGESLGLESDESGVVRAWFVPEVVDEHGEPTRGGKLTLASASGLLRPGRWSEVEFAYDRRVFTLSVDRRVAVLVFEDAPVWRAEGPLVLSPARQPWPGAIDDLVLATVRLGEEVVLPGKVQLSAKTPREVLFAPGGALERSAHKEPVEIVLELGGDVAGRTQTARVNLLGTVE